MRSSALSERKRFREPARAVRPRFKELASQDSRHFRLVCD
jgi:hypothetical protein